MSEASFKTPGGAEPQKFILDLAKGAVPSEGDALYAAQRQRTRIIERTLAGRDVDGAAFEPYSTDGPYYYYPNGRVGKNKIESHKNRAAVNRFLKKLNKASDIRSVFESLDDEPYTHSGRKTRNGEGIRFDSYADFKKSLGRSGVDLLGPRAPHMLQAIAVGTGFGRIHGDETPASVFSNPEPAKDVVIGIYGQEQGRAEGHNTGVNPKWKRKHQRKFFGASADDIQQMVSDITTRILQRVKALAR